MYDAGYGSVDGRRETKRAHYHRLVAAAAGETGAQLAAGSELFTTAKGGGLRHSRNPQAACPVALYYLFHAATRAYEENAKPGGQSRVERLKLFEGVSNQRGDHKGESDDRMMPAAGGGTRGFARDARHGQRALLGQLWRPSGL